MVTNYDWQVKAGVDGDGAYIKVWDQAANEVTNKMGAILPDFAGLPGDVIFAITFGSTESMRISGADASRQLSMYKMYKFQPASVDISFTNTDNTSGQIFAIANGCVTSLAETISGLEAGGAVSGLCSPTQGVRWIVPAAVAGNKLLASNFARSVPDNENDQYVLFLVARDLSTTMSNGTCAIGRISFALRTEVASGRLARSEDTGNAAVHAMAVQAVNTYHTGTEQAAYAKLRGEAAGHRMKVGKPWLEGDNATVLPDYGVRWEDIMEGAILGDPGDGTVPIARVTATAHEHTEDYMRGDGDGSVVGQDTNIAGARFGFGASIINTGTLGRVPIGFTWQDPGATPDIYPELSNRVPGGTLSVSALHWLPRHMSTDASAIAPAEGISDNSGVLVRGYTPADELAYEKRRLEVHGELRRINEEITAERRKVAEHHAKKSDKDIMKKTEGDHKLREAAGIDKFESGDITQAEFAANLREELVKEHVAAALAKRMPRLQAQAEALRGSNGFSSVIAMIGQGLYQMLGNGILSSIAHSFSKTAPFFKEVAGAAVKATAGYIDEHFSVGGGNEEYTAVGETIPIKNGAYKLQAVETDFWPNTRINSTCPDFADAGNVSQQEATFLDMHSQIITSGYCVREYRYADGSLTYDIPATGVNPTITLEVKKYTVVSSEPMQSREDLKYFTPEQEAGELVYRQTQPLDMVHFTATYDDPAPISMNDHPFLEDGTYEAIAQACGTLYVNIADFRSGAVPPATVYDRYGTATTVSTSTKLYRTNVYVVTQSVRVSAPESYSWTDFASSQPTGDGLNRWGSSDSVRGTTFFAMCSPQGRNIASNLSNERVPINWGDSTTYRINTNGSGGAEPFTGTTNFATSYDHSVMTQSVQGGHATDKL